MSARFAVFAIRKRGLRGAIWTRAGVAALNADGSINVDLDVLPLEGRLHLRPVIELRRDPTEPERPPEPLASTVFVERWVDGSVNVIEQTPTGDRIVVRTLPPTAVGRAHDLGVLFAILANVSVERCAQIDSEWLRTAGASATVDAAPKEPPK